MVLSSRAARLAVVAAAMAAIPAAHANFWEKTLEALSEDPSKPAPMKWSFDDPGMGITVHFPNNWRAEREKSGRILLTRKNIGQNELKLVLSEVELDWDADVLDAVEAFKAKQEAEHPDIVFGEVEERAAKQGRKVSKAAALTMEYEEWRRPFKALAVFFPARDGRCIIAFFKAEAKLYADNLATAKAIIATIEAH